MREAESWLAAIEDLARCCSAIVGAGLAGCVLADPLTADPRRTVLLFEAAGANDRLWVHVPLERLFAIAPLTLPAVPSGHTNAPVARDAEKAADLVRKWSAS